jgi:hypothetical protein
MKRIALFIFLIAFLSASVCAFDKYDDVKETLRDLLGIVDDFVNGLNAAESGEEVAKVVEQYADEMETIQPRIEAMEEKYPDITNTNYPEELAEVMEEYSTLEERTLEAMNVLMEYMMDPAVQEAMEKMD